MKFFRKTIFWCHLLAGVFAGIIVLIMSVTGVLLTYERQITSWADTRNYTLAQFTSEAQRLPVEALIAKARDYTGEQALQPASVTLKENPAIPAAFAFTGGRMLFVNPYTGEVLGEGSKGVRDLFHVVTDWHRWLGAHVENRPVARAITGACNLAFLFLVVSGFYLWWPRNWRWATIRSVVWFRRGLPGKARDFNWHNVIGFWTVIPLFIVVLSAVVISYTWASNLVYRVVGEAPPAPRSPVQPPSALSTQTETTNDPLMWDGLDQMWTRAEQQVPGWQSISLRLPTTKDAPLAFTIDTGNGGQPHKRGTLTIDRNTGEVLKWEPFSSNTRGRQLRSILRFAHTGEVAGIFGQTIAGIASAGGAVLVWTGLALAWRRLRAWLTRRRAIRSLAAASPLVEQTADVSGSR